MYDRQFICLQSDSDGDIWIARSGSKPKKFSDISNPTRMSSGVYCVLGVPQNFWLITELYSTVKRMREESTVLIGARSLCQENTPTLSTLSRISVMRVHDCLLNRWHAMDSLLYNHYLLLQLAQSDNLSELTKNVYRNHCMRPYFDFLGINDATKAIAFLACLQEPRWFLSTSKPKRLNAVESFFGLTASSNKAASKHLDVLNDLRLSLPTRSFLIGDGVDATRSNRLLLHFLVRSWLEALGQSGYFNPDKFFSSQSGALLQSYKRQFGISHA